MPTTNQTTYRNSSIPVRRLSRTELQERCAKNSTKMLEISLRVISGARASETMRINGRIGNISPIVLVDSGSTRNFMSEQFYSTRKCTNVNLILQGVSVIVDFNLRDLEGYDVVLGTQWLRTLEPILWDFAS
ncbi:hypothetical protein CISIN_1g039270mg [Citrus sinensis]|uniref:Aspartic peptidase DDI1-type domain-containing protein n=1 Tax=Citrus sinensis TaxID=2711 RepID=A0A067DET8_CITSI|nr:hypothetical protein CISIN_1g039270mg [Citrus sinensis]